MRIAHLVDSKLFSLIIICCLGLIIYSNTYHCPFQFDDHRNITENPGIRSLGDLKAIWRINSTRFLTFLSFALNYHFHKLDVFGYHLFNLVIHLGASILAWLLALLTFSTPEIRDKEIAKHSNLLALFVGLIFVAHPVQTQGVTYIIQRASSLATFFYLGSLCLYAKARLLQLNEEPKGTWRFYYAGSLISAGMAMLAKEITLTLPFMVMLYEFCFIRLIAEDPRCESGDGCEQALLRRDVAISVEGGGATAVKPWGSIKEKKGVNWKILIPFLAILFIILLLIFTTKSVDFTELKLTKDTNEYIAPWDYLLTQFRVRITYLRLLFLPLDQNIDYDYRIARSLFELPIICSILFLGILLIGGFRIFSKYRLLSFGIFWFFITLLPESSFIPISDVIFEHRLYLAAFGYCLFLVSTVYYLLGRNDPRPMAMMLLCVVLSYSVLTYKRNSVWKDGLSLWNDTVLKSPHKARPYNNRGLAYQDRGNLTQAISDYNKAIEFIPVNSEAYYNRGNAYAIEGNLAQAISDFKKAIEIYPPFAKAYNNLGNIYVRQGDLNQAITYYNKTIETDKSFAIPYVNRGNAYLNKGNLDQALTDCNKAIEIDPEYPVSYNTRGTVYAKKGDLAQALADFNRVIQIDPKNAEGYTNRAVVYFMKEEYNNSWADIEKVAELGYNVDPNFQKELKRASGREN